MAHHLDDASIKIKTVAGHDRSILGESRAQSDGGIAPGGWPRAQLANLLTASRFAAAIVWIALFSTEPHRRIPLGAIAVAAALSDFLDGRVARRFCASGTAGRWLDGVADVTFVLAVLGSEAWVGAIPAYVPVLIAASFLQYVSDSLILAEGKSGPVRSRLGHWGGIINYALALVLSFAPPPAFPGAIVKNCAPLLAVYYLAAIAQRAMMYLRAG